MDENGALAAFDTWINRRLVNPVSTWIQKQLHVNRYHLLIVGRSTFRIPMLGACLYVLLFFKGFVCSNLIISYVIVGLAIGFYRDLSVIIPGLVKASRTLEETGGKPSDLALFPRTKQRARTRRLLLGNVLCLFVIGLYPVCILPIPIWFGLGMQWHALIGAPILSLFLRNITDHLWDVDDIAPGDRDFAFEDNRVTVPNT